MMAFINISGDMIRVPIKTTTLQKASETLTSPTAKRNCFLSKALEVIWHISWRIGHALHSQNHRWSSPFQPYLALWQQRGCWRDLGLHPLEQGIQCYLMNKDVAIFRLLRLDAVGQNVIFMSRGTIQQKYLRWWLELVKLEVFSK